MRVHCWSCPEDKTLPQKTSMNILISLSCKERSSQSSDKKNEAVIYKVIICEGLIKHQRSKEMQIAIRDKSPLIWAMILGRKWPKALKGKHLSIYFFYHFKIYLFILHTNHSFPSLLSSHPLLAPSLCTLPHPKFTHPLFLSRKGQASHWSPTKHSM